MITINELTLPANTHPDVFRALVLLRAAVSQDSNPVSQDSFQRGIALMVHRMEVEKDNPATAFMFSLFSFLKGNPESAAFFAARAVLLEPDFHSAREVLTECLQNLCARETLGQYLALVGKGTTECKNVYRQLAQQYFEKGDLAKSDHYVQRAIALNHPDKTKALDCSAVLASMKQHVANGTYNKAIEEWWSVSSMRYSCQIDAEGKKS